MNIDWKKVGTGLCLVGTAALGIISAMIDRAKTNDEIEKAVQARLNVLNKE